MKNNEQASIILDPYSLQLGKMLANHSGGDHNNSQSYTQEDEEMDYYRRLTRLEENVQKVSLKVNVIESNYLTTSKFYASGLTAFFLLIGLGAGLFAYVDNKYENRFANIDKKFEKIDVRLDSIEQNYIKTDSKIDKLDDKIQFLIDQTQN
ncbi:MULTISPECIES: hypothetical protein [Pasteurellaceae]|uniref:Uncharacterized protein n=3 Tax=Pasteurellaceae TaxID=712 RepID=A0AAW8CGR4_9PAST|nr:hypothetical protein [Pasteurella atlantica]MBR0574186.1 hypothetical protein [Pasteurella atlantica]MDP8039295.1 hypothetical protein [Pasteurella atlantica]MDP8041387.1 hypothetical protein [Pasteurella atlantica]MDP8043523.1 hypothetical protein [Pasteurella atlantica]MDP8045559.1 hypothetical protein [Pasteurella atlantica]